MPTPKAMSAEETAAMGLATATDGNVGEMVNGITLASAQRLVHTYNTNAPLFWYWITHNQYRALIGQEVKTNKGTIIANNLATLDFNEFWDAKQEGMIAYCVGQKARGPDGPRGFQAQVVDTKEKGEKLQAKLQKQLAIMAKLQKQADAARAAGLIA